MPPSKPRLKVIATFVIRGMHPGERESRGTWKKLERGLSFRTNYNEALHRRVANMLDRLLREEDSLIVDRLQRLREDHEHRRGELVSLSIELENKLKSFKKEVIETLVESEGFLTSRPAPGEIKKVNSYRDFGMKLKYAKYNPKKVYRRRDEKGAFVGVKKGP